MIKPHDAKSLAKYLGMEVQYESHDGKKFVDELHSINFTGINGDGAFERYPKPGSDLIYDSTDFSTCYPVLKDYTQLLTPMQFEGNTIVPIEFVYGDYHTFKSEMWVSEKAIYEKQPYGDIRVVTKWFECCVLMAEDRNDGGFDPAILERLFLLDFGAIKNDQSPTGYVGIDGRLCVLKGAV